MAKLNIDFVLLDESVVMYGFRCLMGGAELDDFIKNPVMLFMHNRAPQGSSYADQDNMLLPIGRWYDIRVEGSQLLAKPEFDDNDELAQRIEQKVKGGFLNGASIWLYPMAASDEDALKLPGQPGPTVTKWGVLEGSIVDIPNCRGAVAIRNSAGGRLQLSGDAGGEAAVDYLKTLIPDNMDKKLMAVKLGLPETASDLEITTKLAAVLAEAGKVPGLTQEVTKLKGDLQESNDKLAQLQKEASEKKVNDLVDGAITAGKLGADDKPEWVKLATENYETTAAVLAKMQGHTSIEQQLAANGDAGANSVELQELLKLSGRDLYLQGKFERLKHLSVPHFKTKYKEYFNVDPTV